ncbi:amino acid ABC transporter permease [Pelobacter sp. M08fum]|uniref:Putative glutamine transport system permease protein GlnP n=1 Tax=Pelovirga terrestris TaxID=2771352 RepID=A0A8J6R4J6_9BACT|nr:amino acid ABC transporter permease [Pelovirga terrestris]MBD1399264.1 amino acid ABC transporter permease [Pelovirga terrestris]
MDVRSFPSFNVPKRVNIHVNSYRKDWHWRLLTILILGTIGAGLWVATSKVNYAWRWNRVPQYFVYHHEFVKRAHYDSRVIEIEAIGDSTTVTIRNQFDEVESFVIDSDTLKVFPDENIFAGDLIGSTFKWEIGPLLYGLGVTLWISAISSIIGLIIGLITGLCRLAKNVTLRQLSIIYIEIIRGTPLLVQIFIVYFFFGTVLNIDRMAAGIAALSIFAGAYVAEIIRAGIQSIPKGQMEAARSLGMNTPQAMVHIILPQAFKRTLPPLAGQFISLIKDSSLVSVIAITDLTKAGREVITSTFATFEIWFVVAFLYLTLTSVLSQVIAWVERRLAVSD